MQQIGANNRRKSYGNIQPCLPRQIYTRQEGTRTVYQQIPPPSQQLKTFRRRMVFDSTPSVESLPQIRKNANKNKQKNKQQNYFSEMSSKRNSNTLVTMGSEADLKIQKQNRQSLNQLKILQSIQKQANKKEQQQQNQQIEKLNIDQDNPNMQNAQDENQGYTMGNQIDQKEQQQEDKHRNFHKLKSYQNSQTHINPYISGTYQTYNEAEARMQLRYIKGQYEAIKNRRQDQELIDFANKYKANKKQILRQSKKKVETMRALASMRRVSSLPRITNNNRQDNIKYIVVPSFQQLSNLDGNPQEIKRKLLTKRLQGSMSFGKLQVFDNNSAKNKDINYGKYFQDQLKEISNTERILREKGMQINFNVIKNSLLNLREIPIQSAEQIAFPQPRLISNPYHPKQAPKKKKKK